MWRLLRTYEGTTVGSTIINYHSLRRHLLRDLENTKEEVNRLMDPRDSQDVPAAINFIYALARVGELSSDQLNPMELQEAEVIAYLGEMFVAFQDAFIHPHHDLTERMTLLSKYSHMAFAIFKDNGVNFMPNQLYYDMQMTVKNTFTCLAKQLEADPTKDFYIFWLGDNSLEVLFGILRMLGGHSPNFNYKVLCDRFAACMDISLVHQKHANWTNGPHRLKVTMAEAADHLNPESLAHCSLVAGSANIPRCWSVGAERSISALARIHTTCDFSSLFTCGQNKLK